MSKSLEYLESRKGRFCDVPGCGNMADRHHLKPIGMGRNRKRPMFEHYLIATVCRAHHTEFDEIGADRMREKYGVDFWQVAAMDLAKWVFKNVDLEEG